MSVRATVIRCDDPFLAVGGHARQGRVTEEHDERSIHAMALRPIYRRLLEPMTKRTYGHTKSGTPITDDITDDLIEQVIRTALRHHLEAR